MSLTTHLHLVMWAGAPSSLPTLRPVSCSGGTMAHWPESAIRSPPADWRRCKTQVTSLAELQLGTRPRPAA